ncbi:hypothetical protein CHS0354_039581, partial [Potamilus streckersoni]
MREKEGGTEVMLLTTIIYQSPTQGHGLLGRNVGTGDLLPRGTGCWEGMLGR